MPLVRIDLIEGRSAKQVDQISAAVHEAIVATYRIPQRDRFQIVTQHKKSALIAEDAGLGFDRDDSLVMIQIFTQRGRSAAVKQALFAEIASRLEEVGVSGNNLFIGYHENGPDDWSFGFGKAQYLTGELAVPRAN